MRRTFATLACLPLIVLAALIVGAGTATPRVVIAWASGPLEARIAFDAPLPESDLKRWVAGEIAIFRAADDAQPVGALRIAGARLEDDGRTLLLNTDPHPIAGSYRVKLPERAAVYQLSGVEVEWRAERADSSPPGFTSWWPLLDTDRVREVTWGSVSHERDLRLLASPGVLTLRALIAVPAGKGALRLQTSGKITEAAIANELRDPEEGDRNRMDLAVESSDEPMDFQVTIETGVAPGPFTLKALYQGETGTEPKPLPASAFALPWSPTPPVGSAAGLPLPAGLSGGDARRGEAVFFSEEARCGSCHRLGEKGSAVGPDLLTSLKGRDRTAIHREIVEPSAVISPDYVPFTVSMRDGQVLAGIARSDGPDALRVIDTNAKATVVPRSEIQEIRPSGTSIMPVGLAGALGEARLRDLLAFLGEIAERKAPK